MVVLEIGISENIRSKEKNKIKVAWPSPDVKYFGFSCVM